MLAKTGRRGGSHVAVIISRCFAHVCQFLPGTMHCTSSGFHEPTEYLRLDFVIKAPRFLSFDIIDGLVWINGSTIATRFFSSLFVNTVRYLRQMCTKTRATYTRGTKAPLTATTAKKSDKKKTLQPCKKKSGSPTFKSLFTNCLFHKCRRFYLPNHSRYQLQSLHATLSCEWP